MKDLHTHLERGPYTIEWAENFINKAYEMGMDEVNLLEHSIRFKEFHPAFKEAREYNSYQKKWVDEKSKSAGSIDDFKRLAEKIRKRDYPIKVSFGVEVCYFEQHEDLIRNLLSDNFFDYVLGSVHWIDNWTFNQRKYQWLGKDYNKIYERYFSNEMSLIESEIFDVIAHPDLVFCHRLYPSYDLTKTYRNICRSANEHGIMIEMNTSHSLGINSDFLNIAKKEKVTFSTGSDAHRPQDVGKNIKEVTELIKY